MKRDSSGCGGVYPGGNAAAAAGRPHWGPSASLLWGGKIKHETGVSGIVTSALAQVSLRRRAHSQAGNAEWTRGQRRGSWGARQGGGWGVRLRGARVGGRALRGHVTTGNRGGEGKGASAPGSAPATAGVGAESRTREEGGRARVCVFLSSHLRRSSQRDRRGGGGGSGCFVQLWLPPPPLPFCSLILLLPSHWSMGSRPPCWHLLSTRLRRNQLPPPWPRAARAPGAPAPGVAPGSRCPQPRQARRSAHPN